MNRKLTENLHQHFEQIENPTNEEKHFLRELTEAIEYFPALDLSRADLNQVGFDGEKMDDCDMTELAEKVGNSYTEILYWESLKNLAAEMDIPILRNSFCPICRCDVVYYNAKDTSCFGDCEHSWSDKLYVLVEYPEDAQIFETQNIGYPCFNCDDNGARYVPEFEYMLQFRKEPSDNKYFEPIQWPKSQKYFALEEENESVFGLCEPIEADQKALEDFGSSAIWVPLSIIKKEEITIDENNSQTAGHIVILMEYGATRYVAEEYLNICSWDNEISNADNLSRFQAYLDEMNVEL